MTRDELKALIETGREIEFTYKEKDYSITYYNDKRENYISFCEFYKDTTDVNSFETLCVVKRNGITVLEMLESITEEDISVY